MAINKSNSPTWVKVTLIVLIAAFVLSVTGAGLFSFLTTGDTAGSPTGTPTTSGADAQYQGQVAALTSSLQSDPESYTVLVSLGNAYFDWAVAKQQESQNTTQTGADLPLWTASKDAYSRAVAINDTESPVMVDYAITAFYTGDTVTAIEAAEGVIESDPAFGPAHFNVAIFYQATGDNAKALAAYKKYLQVDPEGTSGGNPAYAKEQISALEGAQATP